MKKLFLFVFVILSTLFFSCTSTPDWGKAPQYDVKEIKTRRTYNSHNSHICKFKFEREILGPVVGRGGPVVGRITEHFFLQDSCETYEIGNLIGPPIILDSLPKGVAYREITATAFYSKQGSISYCKFQAKSKNRQISLFNFIAPCKDYKVGQKIGHLKILN